MWITCHFLDLNLVLLRKKNHNSNPRPLVVRSFKNNSEVQDYAWDQPQWSSTWVEKGENVPNYQAEILGAIEYPLVMKVVLPDKRNSKCNMLTLSTGKVFCNNMGVVNHGKHTKKPLSEKKQVQVDLLRHMIYLLRTLETRISFTHI